MPATHRVLAPADEGNFTGGYVVVEHTKYVAYLAGRVGDHEGRKFTFQQEAETHCAYKNLPPFQQRS